MIKKRADEAPVNPETTSESKTTGEKLAEKAKTKHSLIMYAAILVIVALLFILLSYSMKVRDSKINTLNEQNTSALQKVESLQENNVTLTQEAKEKDEKIAQLEDQIEKLQNNIAELQAQLDTSESAKKELQSNFDKLSEKYNELAATLGTGE